MATTSSAVLVALLGVMLALAAVGTVDAAPFNDVPAGHWAYGALEQLSSVGLIDGYSPGFFSGSRRLTRYEMALSLAGALKRLTDVAGLQNHAPEQLTLDELVAAYNVADPRRGLTAAQGDLLRAAVAEFTPELEVLGYRVPRSDPGAAAVGERWLLDASLSAVAREMVQRAGTSTNIWSPGPPTNEIRPVQRIGDAPLRAPGAGDGFTAFGKGTTIARIGTTVLYVDETVPGVQEDASSTRAASAPALDGTIHLSAEPFPAAGTLQQSQGLGPWQFTETKAGMDAVTLTSNISLSGERTQRASVQGDLVATQVNARVWLGDVSIDGKLRSVEPDFMSRFAREVEAGAEPFAGEDLFGLGLTVRLGDVFLSTGQDVVQRTDDPAAEVVRSLTLGYSFTDTATVTAGWQSVSDTRERTSVDVNVPVPQGALHFGLAYEGNRGGEGTAISMTTLTMAGLDLRLRDNAEARAAFSVLDKDSTSERTTSLGLRYTLNPEAAVLLGYKFINFAEADTRENVTTAEFSIRF